MIVAEGPPLPGGRLSSRGRPTGRRRWSRRAKHVALRFALLVGAYLVWGATALILSHTNGSSSVIGSSVNGHITQITRAGPTVLQEDPGPVQVILLGLAGALLIATASVVWRVVRRSKKVGVTGMIVAGLVGAVALLGMLTIGMLIIPLAALLVALALPIAPDRWRTLPPPQPHPGWYADPAGEASWRYWNGIVWTEDLAPMVAPE